MEQSKLNEILALHNKRLNGEDDGRRADLRYADLQRADLRGANLQRADLQETNLRYADLQRADIDFSCWPLWCGSLDAKVDKRIAAQLAYHFCRLDCDDPDYIAARDAVVEFANTFHRVDECGRVEIEVDKP